MSRDMEELVRLAHQADPQKTYDLLIRMGYYGLAVSLKLDEQLRERRKVAPDAAGRVASGHVRDSACGTRDFVIDGG